MKDTMQTMEETQQESGLRSRRSALLMGGAALAGLALAGKAEAQAAPNDNDILNFALNLEYLEAQYYSLAVNGTPLDPSLTTGINANGQTSSTVAPGGTVTVKASPQVNFTTPQLAAYAKEVANDELNHVKFLRSALTAANAVAQPNIDLLNSFNTLAGAVGLGATFDPFANETNFLIGSFIFEDVGVSAYLGAAPLLASSSILAAALGIHAVEAYHAGSVRTQIFRQGGAAAAATQAIAKFRAMFDATATSDIGVGTTQIALGTASTIVDVDPAIARVQPRTPTQVLNIVYGGGAPGAGGAFFPNGVNASNAALR